MRDVPPLAQRSGMLDSKPAIAHGSRTSLRILPPSARFVLRLDAAGLAQVPEVASMRLAQPVNHWSGTGGRMAVRLGPDEWLLLAPENEAGQVADAVASALSAHHYALVDVSSRHAALELSGAAAAAVLNSGCPIDLRHRQFPAGYGTRTLLGKAEVVLLRLHDTVDASGSSAAVFRIECWRSFGRYVHGFLLEAAGQAAVGRW